jgi:hypothetical protein
LLVECSAGDGGVLVDRRGWLMTMVE